MKEAIENWMGSARRASLREFERKWTSSIKWESKGGQTSESKWARESVRVWMSSSECEVVQANRQVSECMRVSVSEF